MTELELESENYERLRQAGADAIATAVSLRSNSRALVLKLVERGKTARQEWSEMHDAVHTAIDAKCRLLLLGQRKLSSQFE